MIDDLRADTLVLRGDTGEGPLRIPAHRVIRIDRRRRRAVTRDAAGVGLLVGVVAGTIIGEHAQPTSNNNFFAFRGGWAGALAGGLAGAMVGASVGSMISVERWEAVKLPTASPRQDQPPAATRPLCVRVTMAF
jgi:hypothetical protein